MPRLRVTVSLALSAQEFLLDAPVISVGKLPDSVLVLPFSWVGETHLIISDDPTGSVRVKAPNDLRKTSMNGLPISTEGLLIPAGQAFDLTIVSPTNEPLSIRAEHAPLPPTASSPAAPPRPRVKMDLILGGSVLVGATALACYLAFSSPAIIPRTSAALPPTDAQVESRKQLDAAAAAYLAGNIPDAKRAMAATSETGLVTDALSMAIRKADAPRAAPATSAPPAVPAVQPKPTVAAPPPDNRVDFEGHRVTPAERDRILKERAAAAATPPPKPAPVAQPSRPAGDPAKANKILDQAAADVAAGKNLKQTDLGNRALQHAKDLVKKQLASDLAFPKDEDSRIIIAIADDQLQVRGFCDQFNAQKVPIRVFYLVKLRPLNDAAWDDVSVEMK